MYVADIGRCSVLYSAGALRLMVFRPPRAGGQSCGGVALRHPRAVLSSLFCTLLRGAFAFFCARFARCECLENHAGRGFQGSGLAPVSVLRFACTETGAGSHQAPVRAQVGRQSSRTACVLMPGGIHPQLNHAEAKYDLCSNGAAGTWRASALFKKSRLQKAAFNTTRVSAETVVFQ